MMFLLLGSPQSSPLSTRLVSLRPQGSDHVPALLQHHPGL